MSHQGRNGQDGGPAHQAASSAGLMLVIAAWLVGQPPLVPRRHRPCPSPRRSRGRSPRPRSPPPAPAGADHCFHARRCDRGLARRRSGSSRGRTGAGCGRRASRCSSPTSRSCGFRDRRASPSRSSPRRPSPCRSATVAGSSRSASGAAWDIACASRGIVERPLAELYPVIEVVGHLHRPEGIDPGKYPIRVVFNQDDMDDVVDRGRLVTKVIYLEDPDQAIPFKMAKDEVPVVTLNPDRAAAASGLGPGPARGDRPDRGPTAHGTRKSRERSPATSGSTGPRASARSRARSCVKAARAARCRAGRSASRRHRRPGPRCRATSISATAAIGRLPRRPTPTAASAASTRATRSSGSTSGSRSVSERESCRPTWSASTRPGSPRSA